MKTLLRKRALNLGGEGSVSAMLAPTVDDTEIDCNLIDANPHQPRRTIEKESLEQLASTIKKHGLMQPIVIREGKKGRYFLIAGQRRLAAHQLLSKKKIPAIVRKVDENESIALALIENINREDLSPLDEAVAIKIFIDEAKLTQTAAAETLGISQRYVSEVLSLTTLPPEIMELAEKGIVTKVQPLTELRKAHSLDPEKTLDFIKDKIEVSVRDIQSFVTGLKKKVDSAKPEKVSNESEFDAAPVTKEKPELINIISKILSDSKEKQHTEDAIAKELIGAIQKWQAAGKGTAKTILGL